MNTDEVVISNYCLFIFIIFFFIFVTDFDIVIE